MCVFAAAQGDRKWSSLHIYIQLSFTYASCTRLYALYCALLCVRVFALAGLSLPSLLDRSLGKQLHGLSHPSLQVAVCPYPEVSSASFRFWKALLEELYVLRE